MYVQEEKGVLMGGHSHESLLIEIGLECAIMLDHEFSKTLCKRYDPVIVLLNVPRRSS